MSNTVTLLGWKITFLGTQVTPGGNSLWEYRVEADPDDPPARGLSHVNIQLCPDPEHVVLSASPEPVEIQVGDPSIEDDIPEVEDMFLIKFDDLELEPEDDPIILSFELEGIWAVEEIRISLKAGPDADIGDILGPSCTPIIKRPLEQLLCVEFQATFIVETDCEVTDVECLGPCI